jgi:hypothetical protein
VITATESVNAPEGQRSKNWSSISPRPPRTADVARTTTLVPQEWVPGNYGEALGAFDFARALGNSVFVTVMATVLTLAVNSMAAYALAKYNFRGKDFLFLITLATIMIPLQVILIPAYQITAQLGLVNSLWGVIIPAVATPTGVFLLRQYMLTIPDELIDAARVDGAGEFDLPAHRAAAVPARAGGAGDLLGAVALERLPVAVGGHRPGHPDAARGPVTVRQPGGRAVQPGPRDGRGLDRPGAPVLPAVPTADRPGHRLDRSEVIVQR